MAAGAIFILSNESSSFITRWNHFTSYASFIVAFDHSNTDDSDRVTDDFLLQWSEELHPVHQMDIKNNLELYIKINKLFRIALSLLSPSSIPLGDWKHSNVNTKMIIIVIMWKCRILHTQGLRRRKKLSPPQKWFSSFLFDLAKCFARFFFVSVCFLISGIN